MPHEARDRTFHGLQRDIADVKPSADDDVGNAPENCIAALDESRHSSDELAAQKLTGFA